MSNIISFIEEGDFSAFEKEASSNPASLNEKDIDGWNVLSLAIQYELPEFMDYLLNNLSKEQINSQSPFHPLVIAMERDDKSLFDKLIANEKIDLSHKQKANESILFNAFFNDDEYYIKKMLDAGSNPYEKNNSGNCVFSLMIEKHKQELFSTVLEQHRLQENYDEVFIKKAIRHQNHEAFDTLLPYTKMSQDELFKFSSDFKNVYAVSKVLDMGGFIPGREQIQSMIELMCEKYENENEKQAAIDLVDYLFAIKIPFNQFVNSNNQSAWMLAIENDNFLVFNELLKTNESVNVLDNEQYNPLMYAIQYQRVDFVRELLKKKANTNQVDQYKNTPLIKAVMKGNNEIVKELLKYPLHINEVNMNHETALSLAVKMHRMDMVTELIWAGADLVQNAAKFSNEENVFHINLNNEYEKLLTFQDEKTIDNFVALSQLGFKLDQTNEQGDTFLLHFIKHGFLGNFQTLLRCAINPNQIDENKNSAIMCAMEKNQDVYLNTMLRRFNGIDLSLKNKFGETVYDLCIKQKKSERMEMLLNYDDSVSLENAKKAVFFLAKNGRLSECWEKLEPVFNKQNFDNFKDEKGNNLLMLALAGNNLKDFKFILENRLFKDIKEKNQLDKNLDDLFEQLAESEKSPYIQAMSYNSFIERNKPSIQNQR